MPRIPVVDQTAIGSVPFSAGGVIPVRSAAGEQLQELGGALEQAGAAGAHIGNTIGNRLAEQVDDAKTKQAETTALSQVNDLLYHPENGYFRKQGQTAVETYDPTKAAVSKVFDDAQASLSNPLQKHMFQQVASQHLLTIGKSMADYSHSQGVAWSASESKARADSLSLQALSAAPSRYQVDADGNAVGDFAKYTFQMDSEVYKAAKLAGFDPDSAQAQAMIREQRSRLNHAMIAQDLDNHDAYGAKKWFDRELQAGNIELHDATSLGAAVKAEYDRQHVTDTAQEIMTASLTGGSVPATLTMPVAGSSINVTSGLGVPRDGGRSHDGIDIAVPVGTNVMAPSTGKVTKVWNDDKFGGGLSVEMQLPNGMTAGFAHLSAANVHVGDQVQQGAQLGLSGKTGNATGPVLHYMMKDADGNYVDPRQVSQPQPSKAGFANPNALDNALRMLDKRDDLDSFQKKQVATQLESMHSHYRSIQNQEYDDNMQKATDAFYTSGGVYEAIPSSIRLQLRPEDKYKFQQGIPTKDNVAAQEAFILNPDNQTVQWVQQHRMEFSNGTYLSYLQKAQNDANSPDKEKTASLDTVQMDDLLAKNGMWNLANPKGDTDKQAAVALKTRIMDEFVSEQNATKAPLSRDRKAEIIRRTISDQVSLHGLLWDTNNKPVVGLSDADAKKAYVTVGDQRVRLAAIPPQDQIQITAALRRTGQPVTQQAIATYWVEAQKRRGKQVPTF